LEVWIAVAVVEAFSLQQNYLSCSDEVGIGFFQPDGQSFYSRVWAVAAACWAERLADLD